jgi:SlyX protein
MGDDLPRRIDQLEEALAHQEVLTHDLSDELAKQWQTIERLSHHIKGLEEKMGTIITAVDGPESEDPPPPHY